MSLSVDKKREGWRKAAKKYAGKNKDKIEKKRLEGLIKVNACALSEYKKEFKLLW